MRQVGCRLRWMVFHRAIDVACALSLVNLGVLLLTPLPTYARFTSYATMAILAPEEHWGVAFLLAGSAWFVGLVLRWSAVAKLGMLGCFCLRLGQSMLVGEATQWEAPGTYDFLWWALACGWCYFRTIWRSVTDEDAH